VNETVAAVALYDRNEAALPLNTLTAIRYVPLNICEQF
jgi:hypothetical protein